MSSFYSIELHLWRGYNTLKERNAGTKPLAFGIGFRRSRGRGSQNMVCRSENKISSSTLPWTCGNGGRCVGDGGNGGLKFKSHPFLWPDVFATRLCLVSAIALKVLRVLGDFSREDVEFHFWVPILTWEKELRSLCSLCCNPQDLLNLVRIKAIRFGILLLLTIVEADGLATCLFSIRVFAIMWSRILRLTTSLTASCDVCWEVASKVRFVPIKVWENLLATPLFR